MQIQATCCKAIKLQNFIIRILANFYLLYLLNNLFCSSVRQILEYRLHIQDPLSTASDCIMNEQGQQKFHRHAAYKLNVLCPLHNYTPTQSLFSLESLADRRHSANLSFLYNLLSIRIDCPKLLSNFFQYPLPSFILFCSILYSI